MTDRARCANCATPLTAAGPYCAHCGQKRIDDGDRRLPALIRASTREVTDLDGRLLPSLWYLVARPGFLSREYRLGRRRRYLSPIGLFLFANVLFFLAPSVTDFNITLFDQYAIQPYSDWVAPRIDAAIRRSPAATAAFEAAYDEALRERTAGAAGPGDWGLDLYAAELIPRINAALQASNVAFEAFAERYDARISDIAKSMVIVHVPLVALGTLLLTFWRPLYYADHVVAALHFFAFLMIYLAVGPYTIMPVVGFLTSPLPESVPVPRLTIMILWVYVPFMLRTAFGVRWLVALPAAALFVAVMMVAHYLYRLIQLMLGLALA